MGPDMSLADADWTKFGDTYKNSVILSKDRIIQINMCHNSYLTPIPLYKMGLSNSAE